MSPAAHTPGAEVSRVDEHFTPPVFAYPRKYGQSVTGGFVYRANPKSSFYGVYIFADYQKKNNGDVDGLIDPNGWTVNKLYQVAGPMPPLNDGEAYLTPRTKNRLV